MAGDPFAIAFGAAFGGALYGIICGIILHRILGAYIEGAIGPYGLIGLGSSFVVLACAVVVLHSPALLVLMVLLVALTPLLNRRIDKMENRRYYDERIRGAIEAIRADPRNLAARSALARALHKQDRLDEAIEQCSEILRLSPNSREEAYNLKQLIRERDERRDPLVRCPMCGRENPKCRLHCSGCEASLSPRDRLREWMEGASGKQFARMLAIGVGCVTVIFLLGSLLSPVGKLVAVAVTLVVLCIAFLVNTYMNW